MKYRQYNFSTSLIEKLPLRVSTHVCKSIEWCRPSSTSTQDRCESHSESQTEGALLTFALWCRSALCCSTSFLIRSRWPPAADNRTAVQPSCEHEIDTCTISPCLYITYYTFHSISISIDQTPQWFLLHCSIEIFRPISDTVSGHWRVHTHIHPVNIQSHCGASTLLQRGHCKLLATGQLSPTARKRISIAICV